MNVNTRFGGLAVAAAVALWIAAAAAQQQPPAQPQGGQAQGGSSQGQSGQPSGQAQGQQPQGQQPQGQQAQGQEQPRQRPAIPAAASSIADRPDNFYGELVTVYAAVEKSLTPTAFTIDQDPTKSTGKEVVVLARRLHEPVEPNTYVTIIGEVVRADAAEIAKVAKEAAGGLPPDVLAQYAGKPVIFANSVVTPALNDLAKFIPPPMTPEEEALDKAMKTIGQANGAVRKGIDASNAELVKTNTALLAKAFAETEAFWKGRNKDDAVKMAQAARSAVDGIAKAAAGGNWNEAKAQIATLGQQCQGCHKSYRERLEDGSFAVRKEGGR